MTQEKVFVVSRAYLVAETTRIKAKSEKEALAIAKTSPDSFWKSTDSDSVNYQVEYEESEAES